MLRFVGAVLVAATVFACSSTKITGLPGIRYSATARAATESMIVGGDGVVAPFYHVTTTATIRNVSDGPVHLEYGACALHTVLSTVLNGRQVPVFDSETGRACILILLSKTLAPGDSIVFTDIIDPRLRSLPHGTFKVDAVLDLMGTTTAIDAGVLSIEGQ